MLIPRHSVQRCSLLVASLALLFAACSDDSQTSFFPDASADFAPGDGPPAVDQSSDKAAADGPSADGPSPQKDGAPRDSQPTPDGPVVTPDGPTPDSTVGPTLPPPPAGAVLLRISVDDRAAKSYQGGELALKGAFKYDPTTNVITPDSGWAGPAVPLWDDGPGGREGAGSTAGDHRLGTVVYVVPGSGSVTIEYGMQSPAGWAWPHSGGNKKVTVSAGAGTVDLSGPTLPSRNGVDLLVEVDASQLSGASVSGGYQVVALRGTFTHWAPLRCNDFGEDGDVTALDGTFSCKLSAHVGAGKRFPHLGLLRPGASESFLVDIGGNGYKKTAGVKATYLHAGGTAAVSLSASGNLQFTVPNLGVKTAPAAPTSALPAGKRPDVLKGRQELTPAGISGYFYVPTWYDAHTALPLLVAFHGKTEQGIWMINVWEQLAEDYGFILMAPTSMGTNKSWNFVYGSSPSEAPLVLQAVSYLRQRYNIMANQIAVEGFSDGASMALKMGVQNPSVFCASIANSPWTAGSSYKTTPPLKIFITHGEADTILSFSNAQNLASKLKSKGYSVKTTWYPLGHAYEHHVFPTNDKVGFLRWLDSARR